MPRVAGQLQVPRHRPDAILLKTELADKADTLVLDLSPAYQVDGLKKLERTFVFSREASGKLTVIDAVEFDSPQSFGTALITGNAWKQLAPDRLEVGDKSDRVVVEIAVEGGKFQITPEQLQEQIRGNRVPTRLGIDLIDPVTRATIAVSITPSP